MNYFYYISWSIKRYIWPLLISTCLLLTWAMGYTLLPWIFGSLLAARVSLDTWNYVQFKPYKLKDEATQQIRHWHDILDEFRAGTSPLAFYGLDRETTYFRILFIMYMGKIPQSNNYLCGPIAFLNFLITHHPSLFIKTVCELYENGSTQAPFYLQTSFWDRYALSQPILYINQFFKAHITLHEILPAVFKNTHNLLGYNNSCFLENFRGCTEPKHLSQWLLQAGFQSTSHITVNAYDSDSEVSTLSRLLLGGIYCDDNKMVPLRDHTENEAYLTYYNFRRDNWSYYCLNISLGHWKFHNKKTEPSYYSVIQVHLPRIAPL